MVLLEHFFAFEIGFVWLCFSLTAEFAKNVEK